METVAIIKIIIYVFAALIWISGLIGNIKLILLYRKKDLKIRFNCLMLVLASFDLSYLLSVIFLLTSSKFGGGDSDIYMISGFVMHCNFKGSVFTTLAISIERYLVFCKNK